jgi:hypothetical protein
VHICVCSKLATKYIYMHIPAYSELFLEFFFLSCCSSYHIIFPSSCFCSPSRPPAPKNKSGKNPLSLLLSRLGVFSYCGGGINHCLSMCCYTHTLSLSPSLSLSLSHTHTHNTHTHIPCTCACGRILHIHTISSVYSLSLSLPPFHSPTLSLTPISSLSSPITNT